MTIKSREVRLRSRPEGLPSAENFSLETVTLHDPGPGEIQVRNLWMSVDPYMRGRMRDQVSYVSPFQLGEPLQGGAVGTVVQSNYENLAVGEMVLSMFGWREVFNVPGSLPEAMLRKVDATAIAPHLYLSTAGLTGLTAWVGLLEVAKVQQGDAVFVSGAAGAVGSTACQIAKLKGATIIGSAGGAEKCEYLRSIGVDAVIDYKAAGSFLDALRQAAPDGISVYFDNVGGEQLDAALLVARPFARFALCGMIGGYNGQPYAMRNLGVAVGKRLRLEGFIVSDHFNSMPAFLTEMTGWIATNKITSAQTVDKGIENAVEAFLKLFKGENLGKMLVKLS